MTVRNVTIVAVTVVALSAAIGTAWRLDAREARKPYPKPTPPPPASQVFEPAKDPAPTQEEIEALARNHNAQLEQTLERALVARNPQQRETAFTFVLPELLQVEPQRAVALLNRQEPGEVRDLLREEIARQWIGRDRDAAIGWIKSLESEAERRQREQEERAEAERRAWERQQERENLERALGKRKDKEPRHPPHWRYD